MHISRRNALKTSGMGALGAAYAGFSRGFADTLLHVRATGNPILPGTGACDPQVRVYDNRVFMYATHDTSPNDLGFEMHDWWVWHTTNLVDWEMVSTLKPEQTYFGGPSTQCWATDAARRDGKYYFYFSMGPEEIGVVEGNSPAGPWHDPLGHALIAKGQVETQARDPGILQEPDGTSYIVFGTFDYYIARLNEDMISLAETPRLIPIENAEGPYGKGKTDDKPFLHRHGDKYYLSWGCYYGMSNSPYGPYECKGSIITPEDLSPEFRSGVNRFDYDRHGSFFELYGQWYFICNDQALPGSNMFFRNSVLSYVRYKENGEIDPVRIDTTGVGQYDARLGINATDFFKASRAAIHESATGVFEVCDLRNNSYLIYPKVRNLRERTRLSITGVCLHPGGVQIDIRRDHPAGIRLSKLVAKPEGASGRECTYSTILKGIADSDDLCLTFDGGQGELIRLRHLSFS
jgi:hypothetical protein